MGRNNMIYYVVSSGVALVGPREKEGLCRPPEVCDQRPERECHLKQIDRSSTGNLRGAERSRVLPVSNQPVPPVWYFCLRSRPSSDGFRFWAGGGSIPRHSRSWGPRFDRKVRDAVS